MATSLTNSRMNSALAARIDASVRGRPFGPALGRYRPRFVALLRFGVLASLVTLVVLGLVARQRAHSEIETTRAGLLTAIERETAALAAQDRQTVAQAEKWLAKLAGAYEGDLVASRGGQAALDAILKQPALYVRGPLDAFTHAEGNTQLAADSEKDAFVACLLDPPSARLEKVLLPRARAARGAQAEQTTAHVRRLHEAQLGLRFFDPSWAEGVRQAKDFSALTRLQHAFEHAPLERARQALGARVLLVVMDEPNDPGGPTELDGEHAHFVRIGVVELRSANIVLRKRLHVDPSWISEGKRAEYSKILDDCALALDVRAGL